MATSKVVNPNIAQTVTITPVTSTAEAYYINVRNNKPECGIGRCGPIVDVYAIVKVNTVDTSNNHIIMSAGVPKPTHDIAFFCSPDGSSKEPLRVFIGASSAHAGKLQVRGGTANATYSVSFTYIAAS